MSTLYFRGSRRPGTQCLCRRHHDLSGTDYDFIASVSDEAVGLLMAGEAEIQLRLRDDFEDGKAPWILEVMKEGAPIWKSHVNDDGKETLLREPDAIRVSIQDEEHALLKRKLQIARIRVLHDQVDA